jgi:hypothetical protein
MMSEAVQELASVGASTLIAAMLIGDWEKSCVRIARVLGRGETKDTQVALDRLERSRTVLAGMSGNELERAQAEQELVWQTRLGDLLESQPDAESELRALVTEIQQYLKGPANSRQAAQYSAGFNHVQHAVLVNSEVSGGGELGTERADCPIARIPRPPPGYQHPGGA